MTDNRLSTAETREFLESVKNRLPSNRVLQFMSMIGLSKRTYDNSTDMEPNPDERVISLLNTWLGYFDVGGLTSILKQFLNGVLKEVTSSERNHELDGMLLQYDGRARNYVNNRNFAWLLFSVTTYYHDMSVFMEKIRLNLKLKEVDINRIKMNLRSDILAQRYEMLMCWLDDRRTSVGTESARQILELLRGATFVVPPDGEPFVPPPIPEADAVPVPAQAQERLVHAFVDGSPPPLVDSSPSASTLTPLPASGNSNSSQRLTQVVTPVQREAGSDSNVSFSVAESSQSSDSDDTPDLT